MERHELFNLIPQEEMDRIFDYNKCEFSYDFLGFTDFYKALASVIPQGKTIIDFGCNQALQSYYFRNHNRYIGIDIEIPTEYRYRTDNSLHFQDEITKWIEFEFSKLGINQKDCFAIVNFVPDWGAQALVKQTFNNVFCYYPYLTI